MRHFVSALHHGGGCDDRLVDGLQLGPLELGLQSCFCSSSISVFDFDFDTVVFLVKGSETRYLSFMRTPACQQSHAEVHLRRVADRRAAAGPRPAQAIAVVTLERDKLNLVGSPLRNVCCARCDTRGLARIALDGLPRVGRGMLPRSAALSSSTLSVR